MIYLASNLKFLRKNIKPKALTQQEFAKSLNISRSTYTKWELDTMPDHDGLKTLSSHYNIDIPDLIYKDLTGGKIVELLPQERKKKQTGLSPIPDVMNELIHNKAYLKAILLKNCEIYAHLKDSDLINVAIQADRDVEGYYKLLIQELTK